MAPAPPSLVVLGFGAVGRTLTRLALHSGVRVAGVIDKEPWFASSSAAQGFSAADIEGLNPHSPPPGGPQDHGSYAAALDNLLKHEKNLVVADTSASEATIPVLKSALAAGHRIVLANKKPLTTDLATFKELTADRSKVRIEATVGAGLPVHIALRRVIDSGDAVVRMEGQLSGTLGYILSNIQSGRPFSEVVREAKAKGFTEPDPRDDLSGTDVARKGLILSRIVGSSLEMSDVQVEPLFPPEMAKLEVPEFMERLPDLDESFAERVKNASERGARLRYAAVVSEGGAKVKVGLVEAPMGSPLAALEGTNNLVTIESKFYTPPGIVSVSGPGAGLEVTAGGVLADVFDLCGADLRKSWGL